MPVELSQQIEYLRDRPAFRANAPGTPVPPNLAGRVAAAFALAAQIDTDPAQAREHLATAATIFTAVAALAFALGATQP